MLKSFKKALIGSVAVLLVATLGGCGQKQSSAPSPSTSTSSSAKVKTESASVKAYKAANALIKKGEYQEALDKLEAVSSPSTRVKNLISDLQNYLAARSSYNQGDYYSAKKNLTTQSDSPEMKGAVNNLQGRISSANGESASSSSSQVANSQSTAPANAKASSETSTDVVSDFAQKMGFYGDSSYEIIPEGKTGNSYRFEVRQNNSDNSVGHLVGIYTYNSKTGAVTQVQ